MSREDDRKVHGGVRKVGGGGEWWMKAVGGRWRWVEVGEWFRTNSNILLLLKEILSV